MDATNVEVRNLTADDYLQLKDSMIVAYEAIGGYHWSRQDIERLISKFPEGQICVTMNGQVVGCALSIVVPYEKYGDKHDYKRITGNYTFNTHDAKGDTLYGIEVFIHPDYRGLRLARRLYDARKFLCESLNLEGIIAGGRIPGYHEYADSMTPREYIEKVTQKEIYDSTLSFQLSNDFRVKKVLKNYLPYDNESKGYATLLIWHNAFYDPDQQMLLRRDYIRIGIVQWQMRPYNSIKEILIHMEYFIDAVSDYHSDFVLFPELFNAPLMGKFNNQAPNEAMRSLAAFTDELVENLSKLAVSYNVNIIAGSMPQLVDGKLYNTAYCLQRSGAVDSYCKIHPTPAEKSEWAFTGGDKVAVIQTDVCKIGMLICYDVEFPELGRLLAEEGMQILFVPFLTDTQNAYNRVRICAQARAIENECFVAIAGNVGNLPKVNNMDLQFAQSAIFTPSDFAFPVNAIQAEATPNTETIVVADLDLTLLNELHYYGSVRTLNDRRKDLYELKWK
ncbi:carbon-nitrogen hydrolase family protein [Solitalea sp. MAHUQ-68]|uniref:Carbon-nitrogen hydrolase family protein n=1 Tax=Solitalea agri TaxID=2953739 RepID=A0A9X2JC16_9SPHI|nr:carbon-nitrogen hydrolase family protein [Solitalea agri]MCO4292044.1 carbon-nitrogen hydrolase family protein [Solitalea agri]